MSATADAKGLTEEPSSGIEFELISPEGVPLRFTVASAADRIVSFAVDASITLCATIALVVAVILAVPEPDQAPWMLAFLIICLFALRNFYFMGFELRWKGRTPGKRFRGLQVIGAHGSQLTVEAIVARNLMREVEIFVPVVVLVAPEATWPGAPWWSRLIAAAALIVLALLPLFNRYRQRAGDLVAGTLVIAEPKAKLLEDLAGRPETLSATVEKGGGEGYEFTESQLSVYGIYELQVLEDLLRRVEAEGAYELCRQVSEKIRSKIAWEGEPGDEHAFLKAFYAALRAHLERRMLFGKRRADKHAED